MKKSSVSARVTLAVLSAALLLPLAAMAQNVTFVNGKPVPKSRVDALLVQATRQGQPKTPELEKQARDEVVLREMFMQEAEKRGLAASADYKQQMEFARQTILIRELFSDFQKKNPVTAAEVSAEYDKLKAQASGTEYRARHILVEKEDDAKSLLAQIKGGAKFEDVAKKNSKDPGSAENGGDLDFANPGSYVPEFSQALVKLKKGEMTDTPVKSQFGYHIIKLEDTREAKFPELAEVKGQIEQRLTQQKLAKFRDDIRAKAKTDYKFEN
ncbi:peptidylprolyl isomerase [Piscinibacter sp.]|jgi:peptidyl-prolyl cis-trans isomerase C|uniref:peptidylprolyl isomerase n=1 Tax=Piscinibacter sp. TaxID=1903157 RepID=UPI002F4256B5